MIERDERLENEAEPPLRCAECGADNPPNARGWRTYLKDDGETETFCPDCSTREFNAT
jgi:DNA-directed RNA polymerase subunit RPC12/RpoP